MAGGQIVLRGVALINGGLINGPTSWHFACRTQFSSGEVTGGAGAAGSAPLKSRFLFFFLFFGAAGLVRVAPLCPMKRGGALAAHFPRPTHEQKRPQKTESFGNGPSTKYKKASRLAKVNSRKV